MRWLLVLLLAGCSPIPVTMTSASSKSSAELNAEIKNELAQEQSQESSHASEQRSQPIIIICNQAINGGNRAPCIMPGKNAPEMLK